MQDRKEDREARRATRGGALRGAAYFANECFT